MVKPCFLFFLPFAAALGLAQEPIDLHLHVSPKLVQKYSTKIAADMGMHIDVSITGFITVTEVADNGDVSYESAVSEAKLLVNSEEQQYPTPPVVKSKRNALGDLLSTSVNQSNPLGQLSQLGRNVLLPGDPTKVGSIWSRKIDKSDKLGLIEANATYELVGRENVSGADVAHLTLKYAEKESGGKATGDIWIRLKDGFTVKSEIKFDGVSVAAGAPGAKGTIQTKLIEA